jgi:hypothetical protein
VGDGNNSIGRTVAIGVLSQYVTVVATGESDCYAIVAEDGTAEVVRLSEEVTKRRLSYLSRKYHVPMHHWYNPQLAKEAAIGSGTVQ